MFDTCQVIPAQFDTVLNSNDCAHLAAGLWVEPGARDAALQRDKFCL